MLKNFLKLIILYLIPFTISFTLTACADKGVGGSSTTISGVASKGLLQGATISAYALDAAGSKGVLLGTATTDVFGAYSLELGAYSGNVLLEASGGTYIDEATGASISNAVPFRAALTNVTGSIGTAITPFTEIAVQKAGTLTAANIDQANTILSNMLGGTNILTVMPANVLSSSSINASVDSKNYGLMLAAISQMVANGSAVNVNDAVIQISNDLANNQLDSTGNSLSTALSKFTASANNKTGVSGSISAGLAIEQYTNSSISPAGTGTTQSAHHTGADCSSCHLALRPTTHVSTTFKYKANCSVCHTYPSWLPAPHTGPDCSNCHLAQRPSTHVANTVKYPANCDVCHTYPGWISASHITSPDCSSCHLAQRPPTHVANTAAYTTNCAACHKYPSWIPALQ